jgi:hypothetical protein
MSCRAHAVPQPCHAMPWRRVAVVTEFCTVAPNICVSSVWKLLCAMFQTPRFLRWFLDI